MRFAFGEYRAHDEGLLTNIVIKLNAKIAERFQNAILPMFIYNCILEENSLSFRSVYHFYYDLILFCFLKLISRKQEVNFLFSGY